MTPQGILFGFCIGTLLGALFHLWKGGSLKRLLLYLVLGNLGFWAGHWLAGTFNGQWLRFGPLNLGGAIFGGVFFLLVGDWLTKVDVSQGGKRK